MLKCNFCLFCFLITGTNSSEPYIPKPKVVKALVTSNVVQVACGYHHCLALTNSEFLKNLPFMSEQFVTSPKFRQGSISYNLLIRVHYLFFADIKEVLNFYIKLIF